MLRPLLVVVSCLLAQDAAAQSGFVQGGSALDVKRFSHDAGTAVFDGTAGGLSIGAAGFLASRWSAGVELDISRSSTVTDTVTVAIAGRPTQIQTDYTSRRRTVSALIGFHSSRERRIQVGCFAGLSFTAFRREIVSDAPPIVLTEPAPLAVLDERVTGPMVGIDVAIRVGRAVAIVPSFRAQGLSLSGDLTGFSLRPGISGRVSF
jgi:hypothetical protein